VRVTNHEVIDKTVTAGWNIRINNSWKERKKTTHGRNIRLLCENDQSREEHKK
jgi:hypothetical protein